MNADPAIPNFAHWANYQNDGGRLRRTITLGTAPFKYYVGNLTLDTEQGGPALAKDYYYDSSLDPAQSDPSLPCNFAALLPAFHNPVSPWDPSLVITMPAPAADAFRNQTAADYFGDRAPCRNPAGAPAANASTASLTDFATKGYARHVGDFLRNSASITSSAPNPPTDLTEARWPLNSTNGGKGHSKNQGANGYPGIAGTGLWEESGYDMVDGPYHRGFQVGPGHYGKTLFTWPPDPRTPYGSDPTMGGASAYWTMEAVSGNRNDITGHGNTATPVGAPTNAAGKIGNGLLLANPTTLPASQNLTAPNSPYVSPTGSFTLRCWVKSTRNRIGNDVILSTADYLNGDGKGFFLSMGRSSVGVIDFTFGIFPAYNLNVGSVSVLTNFDANTLYHLVASWDAATKTLRLRVDNGVASTETDNDAGHTPSSLALLIGSTAADCPLLDPAGVDGIIDELGIWPRVWTEAEEDADWNGGTGIGGYVAGDWRQRFFYTPGDPATRIKNNSKLFETASTTTYLQLQGAASFTIDYAAVLAWVKQKPRTLPPNLRAGRVVLYRSIPSDVDTTTGTAEERLDKWFWKNYIDYVLGCQLTAGTTTGKSATNTTYGITTDAYGGTATVRVNARPTGNDGIANNADDPYMHYVDCPRSPMAFFWFGPMTMLMFVTASKYYPVFISPATEHSGILGKVKLALNDALESMKALYPDGGVRAAIMSCANWLVKTPGQPTADFSKAQNLLFFPYAINGQPPEVYLTGTDELRPFSLNTELQAPGFLFNGEIGQMLQPMGAAAGLTGGLKGAYNQLSATANQVSSDSAPHFVAASLHYLTTASAAAYQIGGTSATYSVWVRLASKGSNRAVIFKGIGAAPATYEYALYFDAAADRFKYVVGDNAGGSVTAVANTFGSPPLDTWMLLTVQYDNVTKVVGISVNGGAMDLSAAGVGSYSGSSSVHLGRLDSDLWFWDGDMQSLGVWKRLLTVAEITSLHNGGVPWSASLPISLHDYAIWNLLNYDAKFVPPTFGNPLDSIQANSFATHNGGPTKTVGSSVPFNVINGGYGDPDARKLVILFEYFNQNWGSGLPTVYLANNGPNASYFTEIFLVGVSDAQAESELTTMAGAFVGPSGFKQIDDYKNAAIHTILTGKLANEPNSTLDTVLASFGNVQAAAGGVTPLESWKIIDGNGTYVQRRADIAAAILQIIAAEYALIETPARRPTSAVFINYLSTQFGGLKHWWALAEGSGLTALDVKGTLGGSLTRGNWIIDEDLLSEAFVGEFIVATDQQTQMDFASATEVAPTSATLFSASVWANFGLPVSTFKQLTLFEHFGPASVDFSLIVDNTKVYLTLVADDGTGFDVEGTIPSDVSMFGIWNLFSFTYDGSGTAAGLKAYVNDVEVALAIVQDDLSGSPTFSYDAAGVALRVGGSADDVTVTFADLRWYEGRTLSQSELADVYLRPDRWDLYLGPVPSICLTGSADSISLNGSVGTISLTGSVERC